MPEKCSICYHDSRQEIDAALVRGDSLASVATRFDVGKSSVQRHRKAHLLPVEQDELVDNQVAKIATELDVLTANLEKQMHDVDKYRMAHNAGAAVGYFAEMRKTIETILRAKGQLDAHRGAKQVNVYNNPPFPPDLLMTWQSKYPESYQWMMESLRERYDDLRSRNVTPAVEEVSDE